MDIQKSRITSEWMMGNFDQALLIAKEWVNTSPGSIDAWLMLAECSCFLNQTEDALIALHQAKQINEHHPMYFRMAAIAALQAKAFLAAHGAVFTARLLGLPAMILKDLENLLEKRALLSDEGEFPEPENPDPRWRNLLSPMWQVHHEPRSLSWGEYEGFVWVTLSYLVEPAIAFSGGAGPQAWEQFPEARANAGIFFNERDFMSILPSPAMLPTHQLTYLPAALHLIGSFPEFVDQGISLSSTSDGWLLYLGIPDPHLGIYSYYCLLEKPALIPRLQRIFASSFEGRFKIIGPDQGLEKALPWLTKNFPFSDIQDYIQ